MTLALLSKGFPVMLKSKDMNINQTAFIWNMFDLHCIMSGTHPFVSDDHWLVHHHQKWLWNLHQTLYLFRGDWLVFTKPCTFLPWKSQVQMKTFWSDMMKSTFLSCMNAVVAADERRVVSLVWSKQLSHVIKKTVFEVSDQGRFKPACAATEAR